MKYATAIIAAITLLSSPIIAGETSSNPEASVYFINLSTGDVVKSPVTIEFGLSGMGVAPAGTEVDNTGHHHLLIDRAPFGEGAEDAEMLENGVLSDDNHKHFGGGQSPTAVELEQGEHSLQLVLGDLYHVPNDKPVVSEVITMTVEEPPARKRVCGGKENRLLFPHAKATGLGFGFTRNNHKLG